MRAGGAPRVRGREQGTTLGGRRVQLYPHYYPAAAPYTSPMLKVLESDFARLPELLGRALTPPPQPVELSAVAQPAAAQQLDLF